MTLRTETVRERLALVRSNLEALRAASALPRDRFLADRKEQWAAAYGLQITAQALLDAGAHILSGRFKDAPRSRLLRVSLEGSGSGHWPSGMPFSVGPPTPSFRRPGARGSWWHGGCAPIAERGTP